MSEAIPSNVFWKHGEDDPFQKGADIAEQERLRDAKRSAELRAEHRELRAGLQGPTGNRVPKLCRTPDACPLNETYHVGALPAACFWSCGIQMR